MRHYLVLSVVLLSCTSTAIAGDQSRTVTADLDRDGKPEMFLLHDNGQSETTLTINRPGKPRIFARNIVWSLEPAAIERAANGSILVKSSHVGVGRSPHEQTLTIAYRGGTYQVVGLTRSNWDRIEPDSSTNCDLNLLTGQGMVNGRPVRRTLRARPVTAWKWDQDLPAGCFIA